MKKVLVMIQVYSMFVICVFLTEDLDSARASEALGAIVGSSNCSLFEAQDIAIQTASENSYYLAKHYGNPRLEFRDFRNNIGSSSLLRTFYTLNGTTLIHVNLVPKNNKHVMVDAVFQCVEGSKTLVILSLMFRNGSFIYSI